MTKQELWDKIKHNYSHLENYCKIELVDIDKDTQYFHPKFILDENTYITSQADLGSRELYAFRFVHNIINDNYEDNNVINVNIYNDLLTNIIVGWFTNKQIVLTAFEVLNKVKNHINQLEQYSTQYINNILIGTSIDTINDLFINELKAVKLLINYMQSENKKL